MDLALTFEDEVDTEFNKMKAKHLRWIVFKTNDSQDTVSVESFGERDSTFDDFKAAIPKAEPRWAVYEIEFMRPDGSSGHKIVLFHYSPDNYYGPLKFFFATAKAKVESHFIGVNKSKQVRRDVIGYR